MLPQYKAFPVSMLSDPVAHLFECLWKLQAKSTQKDWSASRWGIREQLCYVRPCLGKIDSRLFTWDYLLDLGTCCRPPKPRSRPPISIALPRPGSVAIAKPISQSFALQLSAMSAGLFWNQDSEDFSSIAAFQMDEEGSQYEQTVLFQDALRNALVNQTQFWQLQ